MWQNTPLAYRLLFVMGVMALGVAAAGSGTSVAHLKLFTCIMSLAGLASLGIPFLTVPYPVTMAEVFMGLQFASMCLLALAAAYLVRLGKAHFVRIDASATHHGGEADARTSRV